MKHVLSIGGGIGSTVLLPNVVIGDMGVEVKDIDAVISVLPNEDPDMWKLIELVEQRLEMPVNRIGLNKTPWDVFHEVRYLGNSRIDPCSRILKREVMAKYMKDNHAPEDTTLYVGIGAHEIDRQLSIRKNWGAKGYKVEMPLIDYPPMTREEQIDVCLYMYGFVPRLYLMGFSHNNCGGACIKAGQKEWARLLYFIPETYDWWEWNENKFRAEVGEYTILREMKNGEKFQLTLTDFKRRMLERWQDSPPDYADPRNLMKGFEHLNLDDLDPTPACSFCDATA
jgi:hypothetical protein